MSIRAVASVTFLLLAATLVADPSAPVADLYVQSGIAALRSGDTGEARELAGLALEFAPASSDALTLRALATLPEQAQTRSTISGLEQALAADTFSRFAPAQAAIALASLYNRTGAPEAAVTLLRSLTISPALSWPERADYWNELIRGYLLSGAHEQASETLARARDLHPNDARLLRHQLALEPFPSLEYRREIERLLLATEGATSFDQRPERSALHAVILDYARSAPVADETTWAADRYRELGGTHPLVAALYLETDPALAASLFDSLNGASSLETIRAFVDASATDAIMPALSAYTGMSRLDSDHDGFWEIEYQVENGMVSVVRRDDDQDGVFDVSVTLEAGSIVGATLLSEQVRYQISYQLYPFVHEVAIATEGGREHFVLEPRRSTVRLFESLSATGLRLADLPRLNDEIRTPTVAELRETAVRVDRYNARGVRTTRTYQAVGDMVLTGADHNGDGAFDVLTAQDGGFAVRRLRDIDFDGYFEVVEEFRGGRRIARAIDEDDDGFPEVLEYERTTAITDWDLNQDGRIDVREFREWGDSVIREFPLLEQQ